MDLWDADLWDNLHGESWISRLKCAADMKKREWKYFLLWDSGICLQYFLGDLYSVVEYCLPEVVYGLPSAFMMQITPTVGNVLRNGGRLSGARARVTLSFLTRYHCIVTGRGLALLAAVDKSCHQWAILLGRLKEEKSGGCWACPHRREILTSWVWGQLCQQTIVALLQT